MLKNTTISKVTVWLLFRLRDINDIFAYCKLIPATRYLHNNNEIMILVTKVLLKSIK